MLKNEIRRKKTTENEFDPGDEDQLFIVKQQVTIRNQSEGTPLLTGEN